MSMFIVESNFLENTFPDFPVPDNHYESMPATQLADDSGYELIQDCVCAAIFKRKGENK